MERGEGKHLNFVLTIFQLKGERFEFEFESFNSKVREQMEAERRRGEAELRGEIRREVDKLREEVAEVQVMLILISR